MNTNTQKAEAQLKAAGKIIILDHPFFVAAYLTTKKQISEAEATASFGSDGIIRFGVAFVLQLTVAQTVGLCLHELLHKLLLHFTRRDGRDPALFNLAADLVVNWILAQRGVQLPPGGTEDAEHLREFRDRTRGWSVEQIYAALVAENLGPEPQPEPGNGEPGDESSDEQGTGSDESDESDESEGDQTQDSDADGDGDGNSSSDGPARPWGWFDDQKDEQGNEVQGEDLQKIEQEVRDLVTAGDTAERSRGKGGGNGELAKVKAEILYPALPWGEYLRDFLTSAVGEPAYSWNRIDRRFIHLQGTPQEILAPQRTSEGIDRLVVALDSSDSVYPNEFAAFRSRLLEILDGFTVRPSETHVIYCSYSIRSIDIFQSDEPVELRQQSGGGTSFRPVFRYIERELQNEISGLVYFTDLECFHDYEVPTFPVLWACTQPISCLPQDCHPPVGEVITVVPD